MNEELDTKIKEEVNKRVNEALEEKEKIEEKQRNKKQKNHIFSKIFAVLFWIIILAWIGLIVLDYMNVQNNKDPKYCINTKTYEYDDGIVKECTGLGYKVYRYKRTSFNAIEFGPFWIKQKTSVTSK